MSNYKIFQPTDVDRDSLIAMHAKSWLEAYPDPEHGVSQEFVEERAKRLTNKDGKAKRSAYIEESHVNPDYYLRIAKDDDGEVVGFVDARRGEENELCGLYIDSSAYGSGLAYELAEPALDWLGRSNPIRVTVVAFNKRAIRFYNKIGFNVVDGSERVYKDTPMQVIDMVRKGDIS